MTSTWPANSLVRARQLLGTLVQVRVEGPSQERLARAIPRAFDAVNQVERRMSFFLRDSELTRMNQHAYASTVRVHPDTYHVLRTGWEISEHTDGLFDYTIAPTLMRFGYLPHVKGQLDRRATFRDVDLGRKNYVRYRTRLLIDLGGIAKGFAVDNAVEVLLQEGIVCGWVNAGGDLRVFGEQSCPVYLRNPADRRPRPGVLLKNLSAATSGFYYSQRRYRASTVTPMIHPETKTSISHRGSVTVIAASCMIADALTKPTMIRQDPDADFLSRFNAHARFLDAPASA